MTATLIKTARLALVGNPNVGKTSLFNALTGLNQRVGNYSGVTVEKKIGQVKTAERTVELVDLPGIYSLSAHSPDEAVVMSVLCERGAYDLPLDGLVVLLDASNLERNLYLYSQLLALRLPMVAVLNMMDVAQDQSISIQVAALSERLGAEVVVVNAAKRSGIDALRLAMDRLLNHPQLSPAPLPEFGHDFTSERQALSAWMAGRGGRVWSDFQVERALIDQGGDAERQFIQQFGPQGRERLAAARQQLAVTPSLAAHEARTRYAWVAERLEGVFARPAEPVRTLSDTIDAVLTHRIFGFLVFVGLMALMFQAIYSWSTPAMDAIEGLFSQLGSWIGAYLPDGVLRSLIVDGVIAGVGGVLVFLPQILILFLFVSFLEDCGYMARAAFLMDRLMGQAGLSGKSFIPMLSGFACGVPSIMASRTIENPKDRLATMLVIPLMSCSARLPVYTLLIGAFIPAVTVMGLDLRGLTLLTMYTLGVFVAIPVVWVLKRTVLKGEAPPLILELPTYKWPSPRVVLQRMWQQGRAFLEQAGGIILAVAIVVWAAAYFPHRSEIGERFAQQRAQLVEQKAEAAAIAQVDAAEASAYVEDSYLARFGKAIQPAFAPLGWDWRITTGVLASFPAREVIISTLGTLYSLGGAEEDSLKHALKASRHEDGRPVYNIPVALSVMVFFALCLQCASTLVVMGRESGSWKWPLLAFTYMTVLAYVGALAVYQLGSRL